MGGLRKDSKKEPLYAFRLVPMKTVQQTGQIFIFTEAELLIAYHISNSSPIAFNGTRLEFSLFTKI